MPNTKQKKGSGKNSFSSLLKKITLEEYQKFIGHYASKSEDFKIEFEVYFSDKGDNIDVSQKYTTLTQKLIRRYTDGGYIDYRATYGLSQEVDRMIETGYDMVNKSNFRDAFSMTKPALKEMMKVITYCDDSDGNIGESIDNAIQLIDNVAKAEEAAIELKEEIFIFLQRELENEEYFDYGDFGYNLFSIYQYLILSISKNEDYLNFIDNQVAKLTGTYDNYKKEFYLKQKIDFFKAKDNP